MTEAEWLACNEPTKMLRAVKQLAQPRKLYLLASGCWRRKWAMNGHPTVQNVIECIELLADGKVAETELVKAFQNSRVVPPRDVDALRALSDLEPLACPLGVGFLPYSGEVLRKVAHTVALDSAPYQERSNRSRSSAYQTAKQSELLAQAVLTREIFGNPFRPATFASEWRTDTTVGIAQGMYESRDFGAMPILADALQDAGCDSDDILNHCRDPQQVHVRGCWVVDLVLGKE